MYYVEQNKLKSIKNQIFSGNKNTDKKYVFDKGVFSINHPTHKYI